MVEQTRTDYDNTFSLRPNCPGGCYISCSWLPLLLLPKTIQCENPTPIKISPSSNEGVNAASGWQFKRNEGQASLLEKILVFFA
jgi:hypothetical protein